jgi:hypothetical protein
MVCENIQGDKNKLKSLNESANEMNTYFKDLIEKFDIIDEEKTPRELTGK